MNTPYHVLFSIAEEAHKTCSEDYIRELCGDAASQYGDDAKQVYRASMRVYFAEFERV